jgi:hypothetical protein
MHAPPGGPGQAGPPRSMCANMPVAAAIAVDIERPARSGDSRLQTNRDLRARRKARFANPRRASASIWHGTGPGEGALHIGRPDMGPSRLCLADSCLTTWPTCAPRLDLQSWRDTARTNRRRQRRGVVRVRPYDQGCEIHSPPGSCFAESSSGQDSVHAGK